MSASEIDMISYELEMAIRRKLQELGRGELIWKEAFMSVVRKKCVEIAQATNKEY